MSGAVKLLIGDLVGGTLTAGSMAAGIYDAMLDAAPLRAGEDEEPRQLFAIAVATGVINHLVDNHEAFVVDVRDIPPSPSQREVRIDKWP